MNTYKIIIINEKRDTFISADGVYIVGESIIFYKGSTDNIIYIFPSNIIIVEKK